MPLLAKPDVTLEQHLVDTLEYTKRLIDNEREDDLNYSALIASAFHDIGKVDDTFQLHLMGKGKGNPHPLLALPIVDTILSNTRLDRYYRDIILLAIASHHTPLSASLYDHKNPKLCINDKQDLGNIVNKLCKLLSINTPDLSLIYNKKPKKILVNAKDSIINSDVDRCRVREDFIYVQGILQQADWLASSKEELLKLDIPDKLVSTNYPYQNKALTSKYNIFVTLPTGSGKTETALYWAKANYNYPYRIFYILPTITTINAMFKRLSNMSEHVGEYHSNADLFLESDNELDDKLIMYKYYFMPLNVTTPDQLLLSLMNYKKFTLKSYSLYRSSIIIDEIHVYDAETFSLIRFLIKYLHDYYKAKFCIMSATFPSKLKEELSFLNASELLNKEEIEYYYRNKNRTKISYDDSTINDYIGQIIESAKRCKTLVVVNTVKRAQDLYNAVKGSIDDIELLHSRYIFKDRRKKEEGLTNKPDKKEGLTNKPALLIATQLVEVSLDISYDTMFTEACYIDSLIQRCGRVNRYDEHKRPMTVYVLRPFDYHPYDKKLLDVAINLIKEYNNIRSELDYLNIANRFYEMIWDDIRVESDERFYKIWDKCRYIYSVDISDTEAQELLTTRNGIISIPAIPTKFRDEIVALQEKLNTTNDKVEKINIRREERKYLVNVPLIKDFSDKLYKESIYGDNFIFVNSEYDTELGLLGIVDNMI